MKEILWDFNINDIVFSNDDFSVVEDASNQNATLIFMKSCVNVSAADVGVGFEEVYANISQNEANILVTEGIRQVRADGAQDVFIKAESTGGGNFDVNISANYV